MSDLTALLVVAHVASAMFMAAPLYMLIIVNERARLGVPLGLPHDAYLENIVRKQPMRCYAYLAVLVVTGAWLAFARGGLDAFAAPTLLVKIAATAGLLGILSHVHFSLQPRIDALLARLSPDQEPPQDVAKALPGLRLRRKRLAATCLFLVLVAAVFGVRLLFGLSPLATGIVVLACAALSWRAFRTGVRYGFI